jgi:thiamine-monophosphate kinase
MSEFDLIKRFFTRNTPGANLGVGDDAALLKIGAGLELAVSTDMLISGTHFFPDVDPSKLGHKTLAVNLSDMAAMGATPRWTTLAIALPEADETWLAQFSAGFFNLADSFGVELIGGDTTKGPLNLCVTIMGTLPAGQALRRDGAVTGDDIWVSGTLGGASLALAHLKGEINLSAEDSAACANCLHQPIPRIALGLALRGIAHSAIDISDGLMADLGHILERSKAGAKIDFAKIPLHSALSRQPRATQEHCALSGGDDYELCFTAAPNQHGKIAALSQELNLPLTCIGNVTTGDHCVVRGPDGGTINPKESGHDHFR